MRKLFVKVVSPIIALMLCVSLVACGSNNNTDKAKTADTTKAEESPKEVENVKLKVFAGYSSDQEKSTLDFALASMKKLMPEVEVEIDVVPQDDNQKLKTYSASGNLPDVFHADGPTLETIIKSGTLVSLDSYVKDAKLDEQILTSYKSAMYASDGKIYAMPWTSPAVQLTFANKEVFDKSGVAIPQNYTEFLEAVKAFKGKGILPYALFGKEKGWCLHLYDQIISRDNPDGIAALDKGTAKASDPAFVKAADKCIELVKAGLLSDSVFNTTYDQAKAVFTSGKAAMFIDGSWGIPALEEALGDKLVLMYYPFADVGKEEASKWNMCGGYSNHGFAIPNYSKNVDVAAKFAVNLSRELNFGFVVKTGSASIYKDAPAVEIKMGPVQKQFVDDGANFKTLSAFDWNINNAKIKTALEDRTQQLLTGQYSSVDFAKDIDKAILDSKK